ncbi:hypothetical protein AvCA_21860 [Azotobacter vinelandii CA]|uniref:Uncharacterized protein n=2 Tax=Azotobacter vinelandii TaxID=354 RepID=C1DG66_AZOVD|nr:hypothetical protein [Azotobacter vinelandii]ACO78377.1 hypothetical protein Avin_21860 [Azotobacter vinelandii DJ]AGK16756.1 hypothetical protein AvCA_21860 [Azotobacter vinelandii CA]AGK20461.1 hypothetical protein AvCA6_21860 [Azotobacter vinelandii CA6]WKN24084.1 hypothetical protein AVAEIV_002226 [Azotobacter vinelandii]SFY20917.1 hypothetical protein SAMN04244547_04486 [Azotobacter vinelandii]
MHLALFLTHSGSHLGGWRLPGGAEFFLSLMVPELQRRGLFRTEYRGSTLREHLGPPRPVNSFDGAHA